MSYGWVHRKNIITSMSKVYENSLLDTPQGQEFASEGDWIATNVDGDQLIISEQYIQEMSQIKVVPSTRQKKSSPFVEEYMKQLQEMTPLQQEENELWGK